MKQLDREIREDLSEEIKLRMNEKKDQLNTDLIAKKEMNFWVTTLDQYVSKFVYKNFALSLLDNDDEDLFDGNDLFDNFIDREQPPCK